MKHGKQKKTSIRGLFLLALLYSLVYSFALVVCPKVRYQMHKTQLISSLLFLPCTLLWLFFVHQLMVPLYQLRSLYPLWYITIPLVCLYCQVILRLSYTIHDIFLQSTLRNSNLSPPTICCC